MTLLFVYLAIAIGVSFICSILEAVLLSITPSYVEAIGTKKPRTGEALNKVRDSLDKSLSGILILNTFAHTIGAAGVGSQAMQVFGTEWETVIAVLLTLAILYFSEIIPKTLGATYWKALAGPAAHVILWLVKLVYPLVWLATLITKLIGSDEEDKVTRDEIKAMAMLGFKDGNLANQESQYLSNVLNLREICTEEVLTPRSVVHMLQKDMSITQALDDAGSHKFSRMPVYGEGVDDITGKVLLRDLFEAERRGEGDQPIETIQIPITRISEKLPVHRLLDDFIKRHAHLFLVQDEFGQTAGIVTLEDAIETMLGREIIDESDVVTDMQMLAKEKFREKLRTRKNEMS